ncbi:metal ABC transporter solute-binding protein, Zn/Mn family [Marinifilum fragile]|jgi:ABC-type metal ion transport system, periplasmic component/surface adhesin|uniref:metal ABC transporter solute-binding protein, Zn/Mn family n=1 Tax=Marinifilum fragile TaxID=570161 RepID=UPI002AA6FDE5|nr:zinc ABC transporter substrate-binding protein [Marinifilum fragile]
MRFVNILILSVLIFGIYSCQPKQAKKTENQISVSILPQKYFVERIAGNDFQVNILIPPGGSPATYEPTPMQMEQVAKSVAYFKIGHIPFENTWMNNMIEAAGDIKVYNLSKGIELVRGPEVQHGDHFHEGGIDPHTWSSPKAVIQIVQNLYEGLVELAPEKEEIYKKNLNQFLSELEMLDQESEEVFAGAKHKSFMIFHPALTYLARDYGLNQIPIELHGKEPSPAHMQNLIGEAEKHDIKVVFIQKQFNKENAEAIAKEINAKVIQIDPLNEDWMAEMKSIVNHLKGDA